MQIMDFDIREGYKVCFTVSLTKDEWMPFVAKQSLGLQIKKPVKGFRPGTAPIALAEREYGDTLYKSAAREAADDCITKVCLEKRLIPVSQSAVDVFQADAKGFSCGIAFEKYPEVASMEYRGLQAEKPVCKCTDAMIDAEITRFMRQHLDVHQVERAAAMGDIVQVDFTGTHNGGSFPYDHSSGSRFMLGSGRLFAGLDEALCGHVAGDHLDISLTMPEDFHRADVAGLTLDLRVNLQGVWARDMRELNDEFVREFVRGAQTVEEYREQLRSRIQMQLDDHSEKLFHANINKVLARKVPVVIPPAMVETVSKRYLRALAGFAQQQELTVEQYLSREGKTLEDYKKMVEPAAWEQAAVSIAVDHVITAEKLTVSAERLQTYYRRFAEGNKISVEEAKRQVNEEVLIEEFLHKDAMKLIQNAAIPVPVEVEELPPIL